MRCRRLRYPAATAGAGVAALTTLYVLDPSERTVFFPCPFRLVTGLDCPLCGGLRMTHEFLHGHLAAAADHNLLALVALPVIVAVWGAWVLRRWRGTSQAGGIPPRWVPLSMGLVLIAWTILRNLPVEPFMVLRS